MTKEEMIAYLMKNPKYDSAWIDKAAEMLITEKYSEDFLFQFSADKLTMLEQAYTKYGPEAHDTDTTFIDLISNPMLNISQMQILFTAKSQGVDSSKLQKISDHNIPYGVMNYVAQAMIDGLDLTEEINVLDFSIDQIYELVAGYHSGVDYRMYADNRIPAESMNIIRAGLEVGYLISYDVDSRKIVMEYPFDEGNKYE